MNKVDLSKLLDNVAKASCDCGPSHSCGGGGR
jgi:hypothetical protein